MFGNVSVIKLSQNNILFVDFQQKSEEKVNENLTEQEPMDEYFNDGFHCDVIVSLLLYYTHLGEENCSRLS